MITVKCELIELWTEKERKEKRRIRIGEVAAASGLTRDAISGLLNGTTSRFDAHVLARVCEYFGVSDGEAVPFLKVRYENPDN